MKFFTALVLSIALLFGAGCGGTQYNTPAPSATASATPQDSIIDKAFVDVVRQDNPALNNASDNTIVTSGQGLCSVLVPIANPLTTDEFYNVVVGFAHGSGFSNEHSAFFVGAAAQAYCPAVADEIKALNSTVG